MATDWRRKELGRRGEQEAERFLRAQGYAIIARNYRCRQGEIDMVALDRQTLVFVEVRTRTGTNVQNEPLESINGRKQRQVAKAALHYLSSHSLHEQAARFDVIGIQWLDESPHLTHIKSAFDLPAIL